MKLGTFYGIGVGPGDAELLTVKGARILKACRNVFVPKSATASASVALNIARRYLARGAAVRELVFPMIRDSGALSRRWRACAAEVTPVLRAGKDACFLTLGDPLLYSTYIYLLRALQAELPRLRIVTVPGITSFCAAAALTNFPLGEGRRPLSIVPASDDLKTVRAALRRGGSVVLMKVGARLREVLAVLKEQRLLAHAVLVSRAGQDGQRIEMNLRKLKAQDERAGYLSVILVQANESALSMRNCDKKQSASGGRPGGSAQAEPRAAQKYALRLTSGRGAWQATDSSRASRDEHG